MTRIPKSHKAPSWRRYATAALLCLPALCARAEQLTVYSYLTPMFIGPVLETFQAETGISVDVQYMTANQLLERLIKERNGPSADVVFTMEARRLAGLVEAEVLAPIKSAALASAVPEHFRHPDNLWFGLSKWSRSVFYSTERVDPANLIGYAGLADARWRGRLCVRPSNKVYVQSMIAAILAHDGEPAARNFVRGVVANMARPPIDLDIVQLEGVTDGVCDLAIANSYYYARIAPLQANPLQGNGGDRPKQVIAAVAPRALEQDGCGVHMNISGFAMTRASKQPDLARRLMEYVLRPLAQRLYADASGHFPIVEGLRGEAQNQLFGEFTEDELPIAALAEHYRLAERISREEGWLWK